MNLRQKLLTTFGGLAVMALVTAGMTLWAIAKWQETSNKSGNHYQRSLLLQRVRAATFRAFKEVPDAVNGGDQDAQEEFEVLLQPVEEDFKRWADLADTQEERQQVQQVRNAYERLVSDANIVFGLVKAGRRTQAFQLLEGQLEDEHFSSFQALTEQAVVSDQQKRQVIQSQVENTRQTAQLVLAIASFSTLSLVLLLAAYLASDLFSPLKEVQQALDDVARGDRQRRLDRERQDELGAVNRAFNHMIEALQKREQIAGLAVVPASVPDDGDGSNWQIPSRVTLHQLVSQLRSRVTEIATDSEDGNGVVATQQRQELVSQLDNLLQAVSRLTDFGFPLDLNLARTDIRALLYEVMLRFHDELARRAVSLELDIAPEVSYAVVDRLKLREVLGELVRNALAAMPENGGRLGIRTRVASGTELLIEVADNGKGMEQPLINRAFANLETEQGQRLGVGLKLTRAIVEQHGGQLDIDSQPGIGTYVQIKLPLRNE